MLLILLCRSLYLHCNLDASLAQWKLLLPGRDTPFLKFTQSVCPPQQLWHTLVGDMLCSQPSSGKGHLPWFAAVSERVSPSPAPSTSWGRGRKGNLRHFLVVICSTLPLPYPPVTWASTLQSTVVLPASVSLYVCTLQCSTCSGCELLYKHRALF